MEKDGIKMETHQNWIKARKKTQIKAKRIRIRDREVVDGGNNGGGGDGFV